MQNGFPTPLYVDGNFNNRNILDLCKPTKLRAEGVSKCFELAVYIWNDNFSNEVFSKLMQSYKIQKKLLKTALLNGYYMEAKTLLPFLYMETNFSDEIVPKLMQPYKLLK